MYWLGNLGVSATNYHGSDNFGSKSYLLQILHAIFTARASLPQKHNGNLKCCCLHDGCCLLKCVLTVVKAGDH